jgi:antitoxin ParD1/3/4
METILVALPAEDLAELRAAVEAGEFETNGAALRDALQDWRRNREQIRQEHQRLGALWDEGVASGDAGPVDFDELQVEADARLAALLYPP